MVTWGLGSRGTTVLVSVSARGEEDLPGAGPFLVHLRHHQGLVYSRQSSGAPTWARQRDSGGPARGRLCECSHETSLLCAALVCETRIVVPSLSKRTSVHLSPLICLFLPASTAYSPPGPGIQSQELSGAQSGSPHRAPEARRGKCLAQGHAAQGGRAREATVS